MTDQPCVDPLERYMASFFEYNDPTSTEVSGSVATANQHLSDTAIQMPPSERLNRHASCLSVPKKSSADDNPSVVLLAAETLASEAMVETIVPSYLDAKPLDTKPLGVKSLALQSLVPTDLTPALLSTDQKVGLQKLLHQTVNLSEPSSPVTETPLIEAPLTEESSAHIAPHHQMIKAAPLKGKRVHLHDLADREIVQPVADTSLACAPARSTCAAKRGHWVNNKPAWAQGDFDALLFKCRGVTLAIPLVSLGHILLQSEGLKKLPHLPSWVLGIKPGSTGAQKVINGGAYFLPERPPCSNLDDPLYIIGLADSLWALAVDQLHSPIKIMPGDVQWRPLSAANPWLAGTVKQKMCVLIDAPALLDSLHAPSI